MPRHLVRRKFAGFLSRGIDVELFEHDPASPWPRDMRSLLRRTDRADRERGSTRHAIVLVSTMWLLGLIALAAVIQFDRRVDDASQAQLVIGQIRDQQGALLALAFDPALAAPGNAPRKNEIAVHVRQAKLTLNGSVATLARIGHTDAPARIRSLDVEYFRLIDHLTDLVGRNGSSKAALELGLSQRPGGIDARVASELKLADTQYESIANRSRTVASIGTARRDRVPPDLASPSRSSTRTGRVGAVTTTQRRTR